MSIFLSRATVLSLLEETVKEYGSEYRYLDHFELCEYVNNSTGKPACIVGHVLVKAGVPTEFFTAKEDDELWTSDVSRNHSSLDTLAGSASGDYAGEAPHWNSLETVAEVTFEKGAADMLQAAQTMQDNGRSWGEALEDAKLTLEVFSDSE